MIRTFVLSMLLAMAGCAAYHPLPLDNKAEASVLAPPDWPRITEEAANIRHPLLQPIKLDLSDGLSPDEAAVVAVIANPALRAIRDQRGLAEAQLIQAGLLPNPQLAYESDVPTAGATQGTISAYTTTLSWGGLMSLINRGLKKKIAKAEAKAVDLDVAWQEWQVAEEARMQAFRLIALRRAAPLATRRADGLKRWLGALEEAERRQEVSGAFVAQARSLYDLSRQDELNILQAEDEARLGLNEALGLPPSESVPLQAGVALPRWESVPDASSLAEGLGDRRLDLLALKKGYESQDGRYRLAVREQFPPIGLAANYARDTSNVITFGLLAALDIPLFDRNQGNIAWEKASRRQLYDEYGARLFAARAQVASLRAGLDSSRKRLESAEAALPQLQETAKSYDQALDRGAASLSVWQEAQGAAIEEELRVISLEAELAQAGLSLEVASGEYLPGDGKAAPLNNKEKT
jgi:outer membrane protein TolC